MEPTNEPPKQSPQNPLGAAAFWVIVAVAGFLLWRAVFGGGPC